MKNRIREFRNERGLNQNELAARARISARQLSDIENGKCDTRTGTLSRIAQALGTTKAYLLHESESK